MTATAPKVIVIPPTKRSPQELDQRKNLRVAAYCRVSTNSEEQLTSYQNQVEYFTEKISREPNWTLVEVFAEKSVIVGIKSRGLLRHKALLV